MNPRGLSQTSCPIVLCVTPHPGDGTNKQFSGLAICHDMGMADGDLAGRDEERGDDLDDDLDDASATGDPENQPSESDTAVDQVADLSPAGIDTPPLGIDSPMEAPLPEADPVVPPPPLIDVDRPRRTPVEPLLPDTPAQPSPSMTVAAPSITTAPPTRGLHYRSDEERNRSVYRRANPWYRQLARGVVALTLIGAIGVGAFFGVQLAQDWFDRTQLPAPGAEIPAFRTTTFQIRSSSPAPELEGTLTIDTQTRAFEFVGGPTGAQSGRQVVSADGGVAYARTGNGSWLRIADSDPLDRDIRRAVAYLSDDNTADAILTNRLRRGYIDLIDEVDEGEGSGALTRYDMRLNTRALALDFPLQWQDFQATAIPGVGESAGLAVSIRVDTENVLMSVTDDETGWRWQRLNYFDRAATIVNPADSLLQATTTPTPAPDASAPSTTAPADGG